MLIRTLNRAFECSLVSMNLHKSEHNMPLRRLNSWLLNGNRNGSSVEFFPSLCKRHVHAESYTPAYLSQGALHGAQEVGIAEAIVPRADVMQFKAKPLDLLKVVVHQEDLGEDGAAAAADHLRAVHLHAPTHTHTHPGRKDGHLRNHCRIAINKKMKRFQGSCILIVVLTLI